MPTTSAEPSPPAPPRRARRRARVLLVLLLLTGSAWWAGCGIAVEQPGTARSAPTAVVEGVRTVLRQRAVTLRAGDREGFLATLSPDAPQEFVDRQRTYLANTTQLPLQTYRSTLEVDTLRAHGSGWDAVVRVSLRMAGFDRRPVQSRLRMHFTPTDDGWRVGEDHDGTAHTTAFQHPWEDTELEVRSGTGVLLISDEDSSRHAGPVLDSVERGLAEVLSRVPDPWQRSVVVYALSGTELMEALPGLPGGDADRLDGVAFQVHGGSGGGQLAGVRFALHPRMLTATPEVRDRLVRHELTHVVLGAVDDPLPVWLSEGIAEYVSVRSLPPEDRLVSAAAVAAARAGVETLPEDETFNGEHSGAHYGLAWWACETVAAQFGEDRLWSLVDAMATRGGTSATDVLQEQTGLDEQALAQLAAQRILGTYA